MARDEGEAQVEARGRLGDELILCWKNERHLAVLVDHRSCHRNLLRLILAGCGVWGMGLGGYGVGGVWGWGGVGLRWAWG